MIIALKILLGILVLYFIFCICVVLADQSGEIRFDEVSLFEKISLVIGYIIASLMVIFGFVLVTYCIGTFLWITI